MSLSTRPGAIPNRRPKYQFGQRLKRLEFLGVVDTMYCDYWAALDALAVQRNWFEVQEHPPSTKDQVFYGLVALDGRGAILVGEDDVELL